MDSLHAGELLAAAASKMSTLEKFAWKAEQLLAKATYPVPSTQSVDVTSLDLSNAVPAVRHKISATLLSRHLEQSHEIRVPRNDVISERNLAGVYNPLLARRYSNDFGLKLLELGPSVSVAVPKTFASKLSSYTAVDFSLPSLKQQANSLSKFGQFDKQLIRADVTDTGVASGSQDLVVANSVPAFTSDPADNMTKAYEEAARVLRKDGELVVFPFTYSDQVHPLIGNMFKAVDSQQIVQGSASHLAVVFKKL
jgi:SAM-dependent methyltransferase